MANRLLDQNPLAKLIFLDRRKPLVMYLSFLLRDVAVNPILKSRPWNPPIFLGFANRLPSCDILKCTLHVLFSILDLRDSILASVKFEVN